MNEPTADESFHKEHPKVTVYLLHGVVDDWTPSLRTHYNYVGTREFADHLQSRTRPYSTWPCNSNDEDVLTIDDATQGGAEACKMARLQGHHVIFFLNPFQIVSRMPYVMSTLDATIDARTVTDALFAGKKYDLTKMTEVRKLRRAAKAQLVTERSEQNVDTLSNLAQLLRATDVSIPKHACPPSLSTLHELLDLGVRIENHGWSHIAIDNLPPVAVEEHIRLAKDWFRSVLGVDSSLYAVPFGEAVVPFDALHAVEDVYFLVDATKPNGYLGNKAWNRVDLTASLQTQVVS